MPSQGFQSRCPGHSFLSWAGVTLFLDLKTGMSSPTPQGRYPIRQAGYRGGRRVPPTEQALRTIQVNIWRVAALAADPEALTKSGGVLAVDDLAWQHDFTDVGGRQRPAFKGPGAEPP